VRAAGVGVLSAVVGGVLAFAPMLIADLYRLGNQRPNGTPNPPLSSLTVSGFYVFTYNMMAGMFIGGISFVSGMVVVYHPIWQWYHIPLVLSGMWFLYCALYWYRHPKIYESD